MSTTPLFSSVLVANRGEVAVRIMNTLRRLGIRSVAVHSDTDADAVHVHAADESVRIGPTPPAESYLAIDRIIEAARSTGAAAIHPGYGFLSENPAFAAACDAAGVVFIGPSVAAIESMGDKVAARRRVAAAGVPVVPGVDRPVEAADLAAVAAEVGFPLLVKPVSGGGGKGMHRVDDPVDLADAFAAARREAAGAFGDDRLLIERCVENPRHIEIQVVADTHGNVVHLGERECSLQRRHQKIVEETPSPLLTPRLREAMCDQAIAVARSCDYTSVGTVEMIVSADRPDDFYFLEMNTRLQVEHPVTEMVHGVDLVEAQLRIAAGEPLPWTQDELVATGHAIEARVYAEDPDAGFLPTGGTVVAYREPRGPGVRVDSGIRIDTVVGAAYDPLLAKIIAHGSDRTDALRKLDRALADTTVLGVITNIGFLRQLLADADVSAGDLDTGLVERRVGTMLRPSPPPPVLAAAALAPLAGETGDDPWRALTGWRLVGSAPIRQRLDIVGVGTIEIEATGRGAAWSVRVDGGEALTATISPLGDRWSVAVDGERADVAVQAVAAGTWVGAAGFDWLVRAARPGEGTRVASGGSDDGVVRSPMPGTVIAVLVEIGDAVEVGQPVAIVEAMKMEHTLRAPVGGIVAALGAATGRTVDLDAMVVTIDAAGTDERGDTTP